MEESVEGEQGILYHYTSAEGLRGILEGNGVIRASDARFSNDWMEFEHGLKLLTDQLEVERKANLTTEEREILIEIESMIETQKSQIQSAYIFALTVNDDDLSHWRGYTPRNGGYAIGLLREELIKVVTDLGYDASPCLYRLDSKMAVLQERLGLTMRKAARVLKKFRETYPDQSRIPEILKLLVDLGFPSATEKSMSKILNKTMEQSAAVAETTMIEIVTAGFSGEISVAAIMFKHDSFSAEREFRIAYQPPNPLLMDFNDDPGPLIGFKERNGIIVPYAELPIFNKNRKVLAEVVIGPRPEEEQKLVAKSVSLLLSRHGYENCKIRFSEIPFKSN